jgi:Xaa-Pro aminopeptidase
MNIYPDRIGRVQELLRERGAAAAVYAPTDQMRYLTGWSESGHERFLALLIPAEGDPAFVVPALNAPQAKRNPAGIRDVIGWADETGWQKSVQKLFRRWQVKRGGLVIDDELDAVHLLGLQALAPRARCTPAGPLMQTLREIKTADEILRLERSAELTDCVYEEALTQLRQGMTELDLQEVVAQAYKGRGTRPAFAIVCFGANAAMPHHSSGETRLKRGDVVIMDIGCVLDDYYSDITRTFAFGIAKPKAAEVYSVVHQAYSAALAFGRPGVTGEAVDAAARKVIEEAGYGKYFIHRTGHGIGLSGHEPPNIVKGNTQPLRPGMCFSDEPGIYLPGRFGVRIENIVTVTDTGLRSLNAPPLDSLLVVKP